MVPTVLATDTQAYLAISELGGRAIGALPLHTRRTGGLLEVTRPCKIVNLVITDGIRGDIKFVPVEVSVATDSNCEMGYKVPSRSIYNALSE